MSFEEKTNHASFGLLSFSRADSNKGKTLFGSSIKHQRTIILKIKSAEKERDLHRNWYFGKNTLIEVEMSPTQFSDAITTMNLGDGVPVTLNYIQGKKVDDCPDDNLKERFVKELNDDIQSISGNLDELYNIAHALKNRTGGLKVSEKKDLCSKIAMLHQSLKSNLPFILNSFNKQMDKSVSESRGEIDAFVTNLTTKLGLESFRNKIAGGVIGIELNTPSAQVMEE